MKVVLLKDLKGRGKKGDIIEVNSGYAQNYLIPNGFCVIGNASNLNEAKQAKASNAYHEEQNQIKAREVASKLKDKEVVLSVKCGAGGKIFGSVTNKEVATQLEKMGFVIDKKKIEMPVVKNTGEYIVKIKLYANISTDMKVRVVAE